MPRGGLMQIGEVAERTGLSLRTIRHYEEVGLVVPSSRSQGGFRLYTDSDLQRLQTVRRMKPLGFTLEEMGDLLAVLEQLDADTTVPEVRGQLIDRLTGYQQAAEARCQALRDKLTMAEEFATTLRQASARDSAAKERA